MSIYSAMGLYEEALGLALKVPPFLRPMWL